MSFDPFPLHPKIAAGVKAAGYTKPTPIQERALPAALAGRHVLGLAQTGTGKTAAFVLPLLQRLVDGPRGRIRALVVAPTRELAEQIHGEITSLGRGTNLRSVTVYGGVGMSPQVKALRGGVDIVVACPGRLLDHMQNRHADLTRLEVLVLDEADHMFDMGFLPSIRRIVRAVPQDAQRLLFSATMPPEIRHLVDEVLTNPVTVEIGRAAPAETVEHSLYPVAQGQKTALLKHVLRRIDARSVIVFTRTKHGAKRLAEQLDRENFFVASLQGNLSQNRRQQALDGFRNGEYHILVATDIAARGIDISRVSHVINYDVPTTSDAYTHRIGRTGRAERTGEAFTFVTHDDAKMIAQIERALRAPIPRVRLDDFTYEAETAPVGEERSASRDGGRGGRAARGGGRGGQNSGQGGGHRNGQRNGAQGGRPTSGTREANAGSGGAGRGRNTAPGTPRGPSGGGSTAGGNSGGGNAGGGRGRRGPRGAARHERG